MTLEQALKKLRNMDCWIASRGGVTETEVLEALGFEHYCEHKTDQYWEKVAEDEQDDA